MHNDRLHKLNRIATWLIAGMASMVCPVAFGASGQADAGADDHYALRGFSGSHLIPPRLRELPASNAGEKKKEARG